VSAGGNIVALILPEGPALNKLIECHWQMLLPAQRKLSEWVPMRAVWLPILQTE
jgi:hypothetical protein